MPAAASVADRRHASEVELTETVPVPVVVGLPAAGWFGTQAVTVSTAAMAASANGARLSGRRGMVLLVDGAARPRQMS